MLSDYIIKQQIGTPSTYGVVFLAEMKSSHTDVVVKINATPTPEFTARFSRENAILKALYPHPNVVSALSDVQNDSYMGTNVDFYAMEKLECNLDEWMLNVSPLDFDAKVLAFTDICMGLKHAHDHGYIHRDLHVNNVLVSSYQNPTIKLIDFGMAYDFYEQSPISDTPTWGQMIRPPEMRFGLVPDPVLSDYQKGDIYALGIIWKSIMTEGIDPALEIMSIGANIDGLIAKKVGKLNSIRYYFENISDQDRESDYHTWLSLNDKQLQDYYHIDDIDPVREEKLSSLCKRMVSFDSSNRITTLNEILSELQGIS